jgi:hypothetical protein
MKKAVEKKLLSTRSQVIKEWAKYRKIKVRILQRKIDPDLKKQVITSELDLARNRINKKWTGYSEKKYSIFHKSPYRGFEFTKTQVGVQKDVDGEKHFFRFSKTYQKIYKAKKGYDTDNLDDVIPNILEQKNVKGILLVFEIYNKETDTSQIVSNYITRELYDTTQELEETMFEYITGRFQGYGDYELKFIYMRVVYSKL